MLSLGESLVLNVCEDFYNFFVEEAVCGEDVLAEKVEGFAVCIGDAAARFFYDQASRCDVPCFQAEFPVAVEAAAGCIAEVDCG